MAYLTQVGTTTTSNTNLTTATLVHTQTNTTRIRKLWVNVFADQVKGNGDYVAHITIQRAGAGSFYESIKTTKPAAAGVTSVYFGSIPITLNATDMMKVYLLGLATDNDGTADVIVDVNEEWQNIDANGRADVGAWLGQAVQAAVNGIPKVDLTYILGTALTETLAGYLAAGFKKLHDVAAPVFTLASVNQSADNNTKLTDIQSRLPAALTGDGNIKADALKLNGAAPNNLAGGAQMDLVNAPNAAAVTAIQSGLSTLDAQDVRDAMKLAASAGAPAVDSIDDKLNALVPGAPVNLVIEGTEIHVS